MALFLAATFHALKKRFAFRHDLSFNVALKRYWLLLDVPLQSEKRGLEVEFFAKKENEVQFFK